MRQNYLASTKEIPDYGGVYTEGLFADSLPTVDESISYLTHIGLTRLGNDGTIKPAVAKSWQVSEDGKTYTFQLTKGYSSSRVAGYIRNQKGSWSEVQISSPDSTTIKFTLKQPYGLFLASTLRPVLPYGAYKIKEQNDKEITLTPNDNKPFQKPYIEEVIFRIYPNKDKLSKAIKRGDVIATDENVKPQLPQYSVSLPRYNVAFFNTGKITDTNLRKQTIEGPAFTQALSLKLLRPDTESAAKFTNALIKQFTRLNIKVDEKTIKSVTLLSSEAQKKQYDILVYGFNTGYYDDLYPYWHSSQIPPTGMNFSQLKNKTLDRLMEEARLTLDDKVRKDKLAAAKQIILGEYGAIFQDDQPYNFYVAEKIKGINITSMIIPSNRFSFLDSWYIKTKRVKK